MLPLVQNGLSDEILVQELPSSPLSHRRFFCYSLEHHYFMSLISVSATDGIDDLEYLIEIKFDMGKIVLVLDEHSVVFEPTEPLELHTWNTLCCSMQPSMNKIIFAVIG